MLGAAGQKAHLVGVTAAMGLLALIVVSCPGKTDAPRGDNEPAGNQEAAAPAGKCLSGAIEQLLTATFQVDIDEERISSYDYERFSAGMDLPDSGDITFHSEKKKPAELTQKEKALLCSMALEGLIYNVASYYVETGKVPGRLLDLERYRKLAEQFLASPLPPQILSYYISPVSGKVLRFNAVEFEPGQAFITPVTDEAVLAAYRKRVCGALDGSDGRTAPVYCRVYGEEGVIAEEMTAITIPERGAPPLAIWKGQLVRAGSVEETPPVSPGEAADCGEGG